MIPKNEDNKVAKKSYQSPTLRVYGDLHEITTASANPLGKKVDSRIPGFPDTRTH